MVSLSFLPHQRTKTSGSSVCFPPAVSARRIFSSFKSSTKRAQSGAVGRGLLLFCFSEKLLPSNFPNQAGQDGAVGRDVYLRWLPTKRAKMALLVGILLPRFFVSSTKRAQWHCWSGIFTKGEPNHSGQLALLVEACVFFDCVPSQSGHGGAVGRDV